MSEPAPRIGGETADVASGEGRLASGSSPRDEPHIAILDGWRALSILLVLFAHWFPTPRAWQLNAAAGAAGMAIFFALSGFLITRLLLRNSRVTPFLVRRLMRILPLSWAAMAILYIATRPGFETGVANFLFYSNLPPARLMEGGGPLWSLCVEVQFYVGVALLVALGGRKALFALPVLALSVTALRVADSQPISIVTWHRVDEILTGASLALFVHHAHRLPRLARAHAATCVVLILLLALSSHPESGPLQYLRPYFAAAAVGASLYAAPPLMMWVFTSPPASYLAKVSYAVYVIHGMLTATWLGGQDAPRTVRYLLRLPLAAATFALAHLSTFHYEKHWIAWGKRLTGGRKASLNATSA